MKKTYFFYLLIILSSACRAQFFAYEFSKVSPYVTALPYPMDGSYRVLSYDQSFPAVPVNRTHISVYDSTFQYVKTISLLKGITVVNDYPPLLHNKRLLWPANYNDTVTHLQNALAILELDTNYNFVALHKIAAHADRAIPTGLVAYSTGFVVGEYFNGPTVSASGYSTKVFKLGLSFQKNDSVVFPDELRLKTHRSNNNKIVGASENLSPACTTTFQTAQKIVLDTSLVISDCTYIPVTTLDFCYDGGGNMVAKYPRIFKTKSIIFPISNASSYAHGEMDNYCPPPGSRKAILSAVLHGNTFGNSFINAHNPEDTEFPLYQAADCDYYGAHTINVGTIGLKPGYPVDINLCLPYYAKLKTKMSVTKLDTTGHMLWNQQFGGNMNYFARSVAFTPDGGCVVAGSRYDSASFYPDKVFQNFLMKLDAAGNIVAVGIKENSAALSRKINCFPNPAGKSVSFDVPRGESITIDLYNGTGQLVLQKKNYAALSVLDISDLEKGMYVYRIVTAKEVYAGKLLKEE